MTGVTYALVILCVSQLPCSDNNIYIDLAGKGMPYADCVKRLRNDETHRSFCVPQTQEKQQ